jgi:hypothetical protein
MVSIKNKNIYIIYQYNIDNTTTLGIYNDIELAYKKYEEFISKTKLLIFRNGKMDIRYTLYMYDFNNDSYESVSNDINFYNNTTLEKYMQIMKDTVFGNDAHFYGMNDLCVYT